MIGMMIIDELKKLMPSRWRVTAYLPEDMQKAIEGWASEENRSVSNLAATILINAIKEYERNKEKTLPNERESK